MAGLKPGLLLALDAIYAALRKDHPDLPRALVTVEEPHPAVTSRVACWRAGTFITAAGVFEGRIAFGYPTPHRAVPRLLFAGEPSAVAGVLVHEAAHALASARGIKDTSRSGTWHNERYRDLAAELGLEVTKTDARGWTETTMSAELRARLRKEVGVLDLALP
jgi:hypothetical protein